MLFSYGAQKGPERPNFMEPVFELPLTVPPRGARLRALHRQLRAAILEGRLQPGLRLPPTRAFAAAYGISRNTAVATYDLLLSEGYLSTRRGAGTFVTDVLPKLPERKSPRDAGTTHDPRVNAFWHDHSMIRSFARHARLPFHFELGVPDITQFPMDIWRRVSARALRAFSKRPTGYESPYGREALREAIAKHVSFARAVACSAEDITVTAGAQQAFDLLARILVTANRTVVAVENPGYPPLRAALAAAGAKIVPMPVDNEGLIVERLPASTRVVCVTPSHQFPLGVVMSARRRAALLEFAHSRGAVVIEDDYDAEFRFGDRPLDALQTLDRAESVFYVGTFSKSLFPAIRLGFVVAPRWAQRALGAAKQYADWHCAVLEQEALAAFINEGHLARHVRKMREIYGARRKSLLETLTADFEPWLTPLASAAGLHLSAVTASSVDVELLVERAVQSGVGLSSTRSYQIGRITKPGLIFGYGTLDQRGIAEGLARLRKLLGPVKIRRRGP
jgi:GntR family transcriptional regulator / MocR family aminotransferase